MWALPPPTWAQSLPAAASSGVTSTPYIAWSPANRLVTRKKHTLKATVKNPMGRVKKDVPLKRVWIDLKTLHEWFRGVKTRWNPAFHPNLI